MIDQGSQHPRGKHRYTSVVEGMELANEFARSCLPATEFARQRGVSPQMVRYWSGRARRLATASSGDLLQVADVLANGVIETRSLAPDDLSRIIAGFKRLIVSKISGQDVD